MEKSVPIAIYLFFILSFLLLINNKLKIVTKNKLPIKTESINTSNNSINNISYKYTDIESYMDYLLSNKDIKNKKNLNVSTDSVILIAEKYFILKNEHNETIKHKQYLLIGGSIMFVIILSLIAIFRWKTHPAKSVEGLTCNQLRCIEKSEKLRELLSQQLQISKKIAIMNSAPHNKDEQVLKKLSEILYGDSQSPFNWERFFQLLNELHDNFIVKLQEKYPQLILNEIQLCGLVLAEFETSDIAFILNIAPITIRMRKVSIRKKLGITDGRKLTLFFHQFIKNEQSM